MECQNTLQDRTRILGFIRKSMKPESYIRTPDRFEPMRARLNQARASAGLANDASGTLDAGEHARTLTDAARRASDLRADLTSRGVHPNLLRFCKVEFVADNYFHAVREAVKGVGDKIRSRKGLLRDGGSLVGRALSGSPPMLAINILIGESEQSEQRGFASLVRGTFGMFRNPTAHAARIHWVLSKEDAADLLSVISLIHRRLDAAHMPPRA
jgi:uncharacterized protein (TIGR02391 family)